MPQTLDQYWSPLVRQGHHLRERDDGLAITSGEPGYPCQPLELINRDDRGREVALLHQISEVAESVRRVGRILGVDRPTRRQKKVSKPQMSNSTGFGQRAQIGLSLGLYKDYGEC